MVMGQSLAALPTVFARPLPDEQGLAQANRLLGLTTASSGVADPERSTRAAAILI
jgi:hypothetical protein